MAAGFVTPDGMETRRVSEGIGKFLAYASVSDLNNPGQLLDTPPIVTKAPLFLRDLRGSARYFGKIGHAEARRARRYDDRQIGLTNWDPKSVHE